MGLAHPQIWVSMVGPGTSPLRYHGMTVLTQITEKNIECTAPFSTLLSPDEPFLQGSDELYVLPGAPNQLRAASFACLVFPPSPHLPPFLVVTSWGVHNVDQMSAP